MTANLMVISSCGTSNDVTEQYIEYYTSAVKVQSPVMFRFFEDHNEFAGMDPEQLATCIKIEPSVDFAVSRTGERSVILQPAVPLENNKLYKVTIKVKEGTCRLEVQTPQVMVHHSGQLLLSQAQADVFYLKGEVSTSDYVAPDKVEQSFEYKYSGKGLLLTWTHSRDGMQHGYVLDGIVPADKAQTLTVKGGFEAESFTVPAKGGFRVLQAKVSYDPLAVEILFSKLLSTKTDYSQRVTLKPASACRYTLEANKLTLYPKERIHGEFRVLVDRAVENAAGEQLDKDWSQNIAIEPETPSVAFVSKGTLLPGGSHGTLLFRAVNYAKVQVRVKRIFENNILQFLQTSEINEGYSLYNVSRVIADTLLVLGDPSGSALRSPANYGLKLDEIFKAQRGAIYRVELRGREPLVREEEGYESDYWFGDYQTYEQRSMNVLSTSLALIVKGSENGPYTVFVNDINTTAPVSGAKVKLYDAVNQEVGSATTDRNGMAVLSTLQPAAVAIAQKNKESSYLKILPGNALNTSDFDVDGMAVSKGIKAFLFGERGVWRPGDSLFVSVMASFEDGPVPQGHPVTAQLFNPNGQLISELVQNNYHNGLMTFRFATQGSDPTGRWRVNVRIGNQEFSQIVRVETVKPNHLALNLNLDDQPFQNPSQCAGTVDVQWLYGAPGQGLRTTVEAAVTRAATTFDGYKKYTFEDPSRSFEREDLLLLDESTGADGKLPFRIAMNLDQKRAPGFLNVSYLVTAYEKGGDFSTASFNGRLSPYTTYVGFYTEEAKSDWGESYLDVNTPHAFEVVALNADGTSGEVKQVEVTVYKLSWNWWWNATADGLANYFYDQQVQPVETFTVNADRNGKATFSYNWKNKEEGVYYVRVTDPVGLHAAAKMYQVYSPDGSAASGVGEGATRLFSTLDKESYVAGQTAVLTIPSSPGARALVSLEKGNKVLRSFYVDCEAGQTRIPIEVTSEMVPNTYAFVTLIQPHANTLNDAPIRMFGVQPVMVSDPASLLKPLVETASEIRPESTMKITVSEEAGKAMSYVLAVVDEGLLNLTGYRTPDPWGFFNSKEALGISTWDSYDKIIGAYGGAIEQLFAVGGDNALGSPLAQALKAERFKAVVSFMGPFDLKAGQKAVHRVDLPAYIGAVRVMAIATDGRAQGSVQQEVQVTKPLMIAATLPRTVGTQEEVLLPVTVMATEENLGRVTVEVQADGAFSVMGDRNASVTVSHKGEQVVFFRIKAADVEGIGNLTVQASCAKDKAQQTTRVDVINPNPRVSVTQRMVIEPGQSWKGNFELAGQAGTQTAQVEFSTLPSIDLESRLTYLTQYPHGCVEQVVSGVFPQLYLNLFTEALRDTDKKVTAALSLLPKYQLSNGSFSYWPSQTEYYHRWATLYATHFLVAAEACGYQIPGKMKEHALNFLLRFVNNADNPAQDQAYALYVLSLGGKAQRGAMNRFTDDYDKAPSQALWLLAGAYAADGKKAQAERLIDNIKENNTFDPFSDSFDSAERSTAVCIEVLTALGRTTDAFELLTSLAQKLNDRSYYMSTQSCAWALKAVATYVKAAGGQGEGIHAEYTVGGKTGKVLSEKALATQSVPLSGTDAQVPLTVVNKGESPLYCVLSSSGIMEKDNRQGTSNGLDLSVIYWDADGNLLDPATLEQGRDFRACVTVRNTKAQTNLTNLALVQRFPSSWEIRNDRLYDREEAPHGITYQDIRDDRVLTYFDLPAGARVTYEVKLTATYQGRYYLPAVTCEAMYQGSINATLPGRWLE